MLSCDHILEANYKVMGRAWDSIEMLLPGEVGLEKNVCPVVAQLRNSSFQSALSLRCIVQSYRSVSKSVPSLSKGKVV